MTSISKTLELVIKEFKVKTGIDPTLISLNKIKYQELIEESKSYIQINEGEVLSNDLKITKFCGITISEIDVVNTYKKSRLPLTVNYSEYENFISSSNKIQAGYPPKLRESGKLFRIFFRKRYFIIIEIPVDSIIQKEIWTHYMNKVKEESLIATNALFK